MGNCYFCQKMIIITVIFFQVHLMVTIWSKTVKLNKNINTKYWESHGFISEDWQSSLFSHLTDQVVSGDLTCIFHSKVKGDWGPAVNLGPEINTQFNEDRPFLINNGKTLFFSSQGHENMGGYDLFRSDLQSNGLMEQA